MFRIYGYKFANKKDLFLNYSLKYTRPAHPRKFGLRISVQIMNILVLVWAFCFLCISFGNASAIVPKLRTLVQMGQTENRADDDYSCYDAFNKPYKGRIPHPSTCNYYIMCVESGNGRPIPQLQTCGTGQLFDMNVNVCTCVSPGNELCFDAEHEPIRFQCAEPVVEM